MIPWPPNRQMGKYVLSKGSYSQDIDPYPTHCQQHSRKAFLIDSLIYRIQEPRMKGERGGHIPVSVKKK